MTRKPRSLASEILRRLANSLSVLAAKPFVKPDPPASSPPPFADDRRNLRSE